MQNATTTKTKIILKNAVETKRNFLISFIPWKSFEALHTCWLRYLDNLVQAFCRLRDRRKKGRVGGGKREGSAVPHPQSPITLPFPLPPNPLPLSTPATQATLVYPNQHENAVFTPMAGEYRTWSLCMFTKRKSRCLSLKHTFQIHCENERK